MRKQGFTLVELSIVLVILGLLIGGVLTGQTLIRAAELRSVVSQFQRYQSATMTFRDKYFALPGDMTNAQSYWGVANATPATCVTTASSTTATCNGNGDGQIVLSTGSNEVFRFWQHLTNAGLIEGNYDGITHGSTTSSGTAANSPPGVSVAATGMPLIMVTVRATSMHLMGFMVISSLSARFKSTICRACPL